jgi:DNA-binding SARP family transcriptional activator/predicted ATPase
MLALIGACHGLAAVKAQLPMRVLVSHSTRDTRVRVLWLDASGVPAKLVNLVAECGTHEVADLPGSLLEATSAADLTLMVLTRGYVNSNWCDSEMHERARLACPECPSHRLFPLAWRNYPWDELWSRAIEGWGVDLRSLMSDELLDEVQANRHRPARRPDPWRVAIDRTVLSPPGALIPPTRRERPLVSVRGSAIVSCPAGGTMVGLKVMLLGGFEARLASGGQPKLPTRKAQALLAYLAMYPGRRHARDKLAALLWGNKGESQARDGLRHALLALRRAVGMVDPSVVLIERQTVAVAPGRVDVDVATFEARVTEGTPGALEQAAEVYRGDLLLGFSLSEPLFEQWLMGERERLREMALASLARLLAYQTREGATERAIQTAVRLLGLDPLQEAAHRAMMRLYARQGRRGSALKQYQVCVAALRRELGTEPEAETKALYMDLLRSPGETPKAVSSAADRRERRAPLAAPPDLPAPETELFGRDEDLRRLRALLDEARRGRGRIVTLVGEAGIGKTRLVSALAANAVASGYRVLIGRCHESDSILPFGPWVDACRAGAVSSDDEILAALHPARRAELTRLLPEAGLEGLPPTSDSALPLFESVAELVAQVAARLPLVMILEDVHWADEMSLRLLAFVSRRIAARPVLLLVTAREEELAGASMARRTIDDLSHEPGVTSVVLSPIARSDTALLVRALTRLGVGGQPLADVEDHVWAMSGGNPFVAVEAVRALDRLPEGGLGEVGPLALPARVRDLVARRLDRLPARGQQVAAVAAVIGRPFDFALLQRASGVEAREAADAVEEMVRHRVLESMGTHLDFTHDRVRDVAYGRLLPPRRQLLHRAVAEALEAGAAAMGGTDQLAERAEQLAHHYTQAGLAAPAMAYWQRASQRSSARSAYVETVAQCRRALELLAALPESPELVQHEILLQTTLAPALMAVKGPATPEAETAFSRALDLCRHVGDTPQLFTALMGLWQYYLVRAQHHTARELGERLLGLARSVGDPVMLVQAHRASGESLQNLGEHARALEHLRQGSALYDSQHHRSLTFTEPGVFCLAFSSWVLWPLGHTDEALRKSQEAMALARELSFPHTLAAVHFFASMIHKFRGEPALCQERAEGAIALGREHGMPHWTMFGTIMRGWAQAMEGQFDEGIAQIEEGLATQQGVGAGIARPCFLFALAEAHGAAGHADTALRVLDEAVALIERTGERYQEPEVHRLRGELLSLLAAPDVRQAEEAFHHALAAARRQEARSWELRAATSLSRLWQRRGKPAEARELLAPVCAGFTGSLHEPDLLAARALLDRL